MQVLYRGAESIVYLGTYDGHPAVIKDRVMKGYRIVQIDERLRRERTKNEAKLLSDARSIGVPTPQVFYVDEKECRIVMEYVEGEMVKTVLLRLAESEGKVRNADSIESLCKQSGRSIGRLHAGGMVHGDITTSNMLLQKSSGKVFFVDFGLGSHSRRAEDLGTDLKLLREALKSTHFAVQEQCWAAMLAGYKEEFKNAESVIEKVETIGGRGRYARRNEIKPGSDSGKVQRQKQA
jgi:Kae1-associated kinase Bud32